MLYNKVERPVKYKYPSYITYYSAFVNRYFYDLSAVLKRIINFRGLNT